MQQQPFPSPGPAPAPVPDSGHAVDPPAAHEPPNVRADAATQTAPDWALLRATLPFRRAQSWRSLWQVVSTLLLFASCCALVALQPAWWVKLLLVLPAAGLLVRLFVLQHDCGHGSLFNSPRANALAGHLLACITTVPFRLWAAEHHWHHNNQGKLEHRGVDLMNSPMTLDEAAADAHGRRYREDKVTPFNVFCIGAWSLLVERKFTRDFFLFRKAFRWPVPNERKLRRSIWFAHLGSLAMHGTLLFALGWLNYLSFIVPASFLAAGFGSLLFWVQHNFEDTYFDRLADWRFDKVGTQGSSYLKLPQPLRWFTADIGLHHVHHLNAHIPNYRLEEARRALPALAAVQPLTPAQLRATFHKLFWDEKARKMVAWPGPHN